MNTIIEVLENWIQHVITSILIPLQTIYYILLVILLVLPLFVGIVTIIRFWCLSFLRTFFQLVFPLVSTNGTCACRTNVRVLILEDNSSFLLHLQRERTTPNYLINCNRAVVSSKNAMALVPSRKVHSPSLKKREETTGPSLACWSTSSLKSFRRSATGKTVMNRTEYLDLSLRKYANTPQKFYKDETPIYFKFVADL